IEEKKRRYHSGPDEIDHTDFADYFRDGRHVWQRPAFVDEELAPSFLAPLNDLFTEWVSIIDLEQEVFSVNNETHYHLANLPGEDHWCFIDDQGCNNIPNDIPAEYLTSLATAELSSDTALSQYILPPRQLIRAKDIGSIPWSKRHSAIFRTLLFSKFRAQKGLSATLLEWQAEDFAFREVAYTILCIAAGGKYLTVTKDDLIKQDTAHALLYKQPTKKGQIAVERPVGTDAVAASAETQSDCSSEFLSQFLSGSHLDRASPGLSTRETVYWFNGALVILLIRLKDAKALERGLQQVVQY
ncbi:MAG: hypothetical protein Q9180_009567, partial [Flavoplaca navasiana]